MAEAEANGVDGANNGVDLGTELWSHPKPETSQLWQFLERVNKERNLKLRNYHDLYRWSIDNISDFWGDAWRAVGIRASEDFTKARHLSSAEVAKQDD